MRAIFILTTSAVWGIASFPALGVHTHGWQWQMMAAFAQACHPSYQGVCLPPNAPDVDCRGGMGDGPIYTTGPVRVVGPDDYALDGESDGTACERPEPARPRLAAEERAAP